MPLTVGLAEVLRKAISSRLADVHTALPGVVISYDRQTQTADVLPVIRGVVFTEDDDPLLEDVTVIPNVPVAWPRGGGYSLQFPLKKDDHVWLIFSEAATAQWRVSGEVSEPGDLARHDWSYPIALPCIAPDAKPLPELDGGPKPTDPGSEAALDCPGPFRIGGPSADFVALSAKVDAQFAKIAQLFSSWTPVAQDGGAALKLLTNSLHFDSVKSTKVKAE